MKISQFIILQFILTIVGIYDWLIFSIILIDNGFGKNISIVIIGIIVSIAYFFITWILIRIKNESSIRAGTRQ